MPRPTTMGESEQNLRNDLGEAVTALRSTMNRLPVPFDVTADGADLLLDSALRSLSDAESATSGLAALEAATEEGAMLAASASVVVQSIRHSLALLFAELDASDAA